jgi:hypothetical protein
MNTEHEHTNEELDKTIPMTLEEVEAPTAHSKKAQAEATLTKEQIDERMEKRRITQLLASMNRKQRRAYLSGRRAGLSEDEAIQAIRARR